MAAPVFYFVGGEDFDFTSIGTVSVDTTSGHYRSSYCRCGLKAADGSSSWHTGNVTGGVTSAWFHARCWMLLSGGTGSDGGAGQNFIKITDAGEITRLAIRFNTTGGSTHSNTDPTFWALVKVNAAGTVTSLANFSGTLTGSPASPDAIDIQVLNYATGGSGAVNVYINGTLVCSVSGATLATDSNTTINGLALSGIAASTVNSAQLVPITYSEVIVSDSDTRFMSVATLTPQANGNTDNWDIGGVTNVNELTLDDTTINASGTAAQIQDYTVNALPSGTFGVLALVIAARAMAGASGGPSKMDFGTHESGTDYWSSDITLPASLQRVQNTFYTDPATSAPWSTTTIGAVGFNIGMKSVT